jgi:hypothetical protein
VRPEGLCQWKILIQIQILTCNGTASGALCDAAQNLPSGSLLSKCPTFHFCRPESADFSGPILPDVNVLQNYL